MTRRTRIIGLGATLAVGLALRAYGLGWGLPDLFEEATPFFRAWDLWKLGRPEGPTADPGFYRYPSLAIYAQALVQAVAITVRWLAGGAEAVRSLPADFVADRAPWLLAGRAVTTAFGLGLVAALFSLGRRLGGLPVAIVAAGAAAVNAVLVSHSQTINVDMPAAALTAATLAAAVAVVHRPTRRASLAAGLFLGLATSAKYPSALLVVPVALAHLLAPREEGGPSRWIGLAGSAAAALAAFVLTSPFVLIRLGEAWADISSEREHMRRGHFGTGEQAAWIFYARMLALRVLGPVGAAAALAALAVGGWQRRRDVLVVGSFAVVAFATLGAWEMRAERYVLLVVPPVLALAAWLTGEVLVRYRRWLGLAAGGLVIVSGAWSLPTVWNRAQQEDPRTAAREWIEAHVPTGAFLLMEAWGPDLLEPEDLWSMSVELRRRLVDRVDRPLYGVQYLPTYQSQPELSEAFYDPDLFPDVDVIVLTGDVAERYAREPDRFPFQLAFHDAVRRSFAQVGRFTDAERPDAWVEIYARRGVAVTFAQRRDAVGPRPLRADRRRPPAGEAIWFSKLGLNYETFSYLDEAILAYRWALQIPGALPETILGAASGLARCHVASGDRAAAKAALLDAAESCGARPEGTRLRQMARELDVPTG